MLIAVAITAVAAAIVAFYTFAVRNAPLHEEDDSGIPAPVLGEVVELPFADSDERHAA